MVNTCCNQHAILQLQKCTNHKQKRNSQGAYFLTSVCITLLMIVVVCSKLNLVEGSKSAPDIGLCETVVDKTPTLIDCLSGQENFCCNTELMITWNNVTKWGKKCCSETEFVLQNADWLTAAMLELLTVCLVLLCLALNNIQWFVHGGNISNHEYDQRHDSGYPGFFQFNNID